MQWYFTLHVTHCHLMGVPRLCNFLWSSVELWKMWSSGPPPHILIPDKQNLHELDIFWFPLLFCFGSSSTTVLLMLLYNFNCHGIEKCLIVSNSLKWFAVLVQSTLSFYTISGNFEGWLNTCYHTPLRESRSFYLHFSILSAFDRREGLFFSNCKPFWDISDLIRQWF